MKNVVKAMAITGVALFSLMLVRGGALAQSDVEKKDIVVGAMSKIRHHNPDFKIRLKPVSKSGKFYVGDPVAFEVTSSKDAYITIIDVGTSGKAHVIFPNRWNKNNKIRKGKLYRIPGSNAEYSFKLRGPAGTNYVKAIATLRPVQFFRREALTDAEEGFAEIKSPDKAAKDISVELGKQDKKGWAETEARFTLRSKRGEDRDEEELEPIAESRQGRFKVKLWTDRRSYRVGDPVTFYFFAEDDCYLNLVNYGTSGKVRVIFPNRLQKDNFVKGGEVVTIPVKKEDEFLFRLKGPEGVERVEAVVTSHRVHLYPGSYDWEKYVYQPWDEKAEVVGKDIEAQLREVPEDFYITAKTKFKVRH
jgi:hypothetical protein